VRVDKTELDSASPQMRAVIETARQVARTDANILILGPSGTGKGVLAAAVHRWSARKDGDFVTINCPSLSAELLESELFGHNRGAFTGASQSTVGRVTQADGGTLFMDEIGDFPLPLQPKLLRFIQDKEYERVGDPVTRRADVRIISATNRNLDAMVAEGRFRQDLLYRLNVIVLTIPALRERVEDIEALALAFVERFARAYGRPARRLSPAALDALRQYPWPGNVRELQNVIERAVILCARDTLEPMDFALGAVAPEVSARSGDTGASTSIESLVGSTAITLEALERRHLEAVVAACDTLDQAARALGIDSSTLYRKRRAYQVADRARAEGKTS
jgi:NtrC-family two-component system response regulator AlgB